MATLTITKSYEDNKTLFESSITAITAAVEKLVNDALLDASNFVNSTVTADKLNSNSIDSNYLEVDGTSLQIKENSIIPDKLTLDARHAPIGNIALFHTFNGLLSIPRGWMTCIATQVNQTNYDALHGSGAYAADGIASSALLNKYTPGFNSNGAYAKGVSSTSESGVSPLSSGGSSTIDTQHYHDWAVLPSFFSGDPWQVFTLSGYQNLSTNGAGSHRALSVGAVNEIGIIPQGWDGNEVQWTTKSNSDFALNSDPLHNTFMYIIKVI